MTREQRLPMVRTYAVLLQLDINASAVLGLPALLSHGKSHAKLYSSFLLRDSVPDHDETKQIFASVKSLELGCLIHSYLESVLTNRPFSPDEEKTESNFPSVDISKLDEIEQSLRDWMKAANPILSSLGQGGKNLK